GAAPVGAGGRFVGPYRAAASSTTTVIGSSLNPSASGVPVTFTATVTCGSNPQGGACQTAGQAVTVGTVVIAVDSNNNCGGGSAILLTPPVGITPDANGQVVVTTSTLSVGIHTVRACYTGTPGNTGTGSSSGAL